MSPRSTSNGNARGNSAARRRRREWLVETYRAEVDILVGEDGEDVAQSPVAAGRGELYGDGWRMACRCYRCGELLTIETVTVDRIVPGCEGGTYARENIRPACGRDNSSTGGKIGAARAAAARELEAVAS